MRRKYHPLIEFLALAILAGCQVEAEESSRNWTSADGRSISGTLESFDGQNIQLRTPRGLFRIPLGNLSRTDQDYVKKWKSTGAPPAAKPEAPAKLGEWPEKVEVPLDLPIEERSEGVNYIYCSPHFEFRTGSHLSKTVVQEFARIFEATYLGVKAVPVGLDPILPKEGRFITELFPNMQAYLDAGGMKGSGGSFSWKSRNGEYVEGKIMVPLTSLGVEKVGQRYIVDQDKESGTLVHEITHQVAVRWSVLGVPVWFSEGIAEYMRCAPYSKGKMRLAGMARAVEADLMKNAKDKKFWMIPVEKLMTISHEAWATELAEREASANYASANALTTFFLHLDGAKNGQPVFDFLRALEARTKPDKAVADHLMRGRSYAQLQTEVQEAWRGAGLRIEFE